MIELHARVEARTLQILSAQPDWPCRRGCDHCCRHLAAIPELTAPEWELLRQGLAKLPPAVRETVCRNIAQLANEARPYTCPLLDRDTGACLVYDQRPLDCRMYGFYVERDLGLYCSQIAAAQYEVIWGNAESIHADARRILGPARRLTDWFAIAKTETPSQSPAPSQTQLAG